MAMMISWFRLVPHDGLLIRLAEGWAISDDLYDTPHGFHACLCIWAGEGEPT
jgi:hypothetical protein